MKNFFFEDFTKSVNEGLKGLDGFFQTLTKKVDETLKDIVGINEDDVDDNDNNKNKKETLKFLQIFKLPNTETLIFDNSCRAVIVGGSIEGHCYLSPNYFCFVWYWQEQPSTVVIPLHEVEKVTSAIAMPKSTKSNSNNIEVSILPSDIIDSTVKTNSNLLQLWTKDQKMHQFFGFSLTFEKIFGLVNSALLANKQKTTTKGSSQYVPYPVPKN